MNTDYLVASDVVSRSNQDGTVIIMKMDESNVFYKLSGITAEVWRSLHDKSSLPGLRARIISESNVDEKQLDSDISGLIIKLEEKKLILKS